MSSELLPAIALLESEYDEMERKAQALLSTINMLRARANMGEKQPGSGLTTSATGAASVITQIKPDTFYGKKLQTAVREYLEMRKAQGLGPAKPREIYDSITAGGYQFETSNIENALVGLRAMLRKRTQFFHKLPNGTYGMTAWYPHAKTAKSPPVGSAPSDDEDDGDDGSDAATVEDDEFAEVV